MGGSANVAALAAWSSSHSSAPETLARAGVCRLRHLCCGGAAFGVVAAWQIHERHEAVRVSTGSRGWRGSPKKGKLHVPGPCGLWMTRNPICIDAPWRPVRSVASARPLEQLRFAADGAVCGILLWIAMLSDALQRPWSLRETLPRVGRRTTPRSTSAASATAAWQTARLLTRSEWERSWDTHLEAVCARLLHPSRRV